MEDEEFRQLQEEHVRIQETIVSTGWLLLLQRAHKQMTMLQSRVINGRCQTYEEYVAECAFMDGMSFVLDLPGKVEKELMGEVSQRKEAE